MSNKCSEQSQLRKTWPSGISQGSL